MTLDPRITPARGDIAAKHLEGQVEAKTFVEGASWRVATGHAALRKSPEPEAEQVNQALFGETFVSYEQKNGWAWGQLQQDGYVGWMSLANLTDRVVEPTHRVSALATFAFERPDLKSRPLMSLGMNAKLVVTPGEGVWVKADGAGFVYAGHVAAIGQREPDFVGVAERFVGSPYLWGGREAAGIDCSGLVQTSLEATGHFAPRDSDMQAGALGHAIDPGADFSKLKRGDLIFWRGHVGIMLDDKRLLHANAWHMATEIELLQEALERITPAAGPVKVVRRFS